MRQCFNERRAAFISGDLDTVKSKRKELNSILTKNRMKFKEKVESQFCSGNIREAWNGLNTMMGKEDKKHKQDDLLNKGTFLNDLNLLYARFNNSSCSTFNDNLYIFSNTTDHSAITLTETEVAASLARIKPNKANGPDG